MRFNNPTFKALSILGAFSRPPTEEQKTATAEAAQALLDDTANAAGQHASDSIRLLAAAAVQEWAATDNLDDGEALTDRLYGLMVGVADDDKDGDISDDEADLIELAYNAGADYMVSKGVSEGDVKALIEDNDADAASRIVELLKDGGDDDMDSFVFDAESSESVLDSVLDAVYKKKTVIRGGKKMRVMKRVSGHVRLSAAQKVGIRKAGRKAHSATARMHRMKSMKIRRRAGL